MNSISDIIAGAAIALLSGMGVGSAGLLVVWLTLTSDIAQVEAQALNLCFFMFSSAASLILHVRKRKIFWSADLFMIAAGVAGAVAGSALSSRIDPAILRRLFGGMLTFCGIASLKASLSPFIQRFYNKNKKINVKNQ